MTQICPTPIQLCRVRVTRLTAAGAVAAAPNNHVVSDAAITLTMEPRLVAGDEKTLVNGCDCLYAYYRGKDKFVGWNLTLDLAALNPALTEIMTAAPVIANSVTELIGNSWPDQTSCAATQQPMVMFEAWANAQLADAPVTATPYIRWTFPGTFWQTSTLTQANDFNPYQLKGYTRGNAIANPYIDWPTGISMGRQGGYFYDTALPAAYCGYSSTST